MRCATFFVEKPAYIALTGMRCISNVLHNFFADGRSQISQKQYSAPVAIIVKAVRRVAPMAGLRLPDVHVDNVLLWDSITFSCCSFPHTDLCMADLGSTNRSANAQDSVQRSQASHGPDLYLKICSTEMWCSLTRKVIGWIHSQSQGSP